MAEVAAEEAGDTGTPKPASRVPDDWHRATLTQGEAKRDAVRASGMLKEEAADRKRMRRDEARTQKKRERQRGPRRERARSGTEHEEKD